MSRIADYRIMIDGRRAEDFGLYEVSSIEVCASDRQPWYARICGGDSNRALLDEALTNEGAELTIELGFGEDVRRLWGVYTVVRPSYRYEDGLSLELEMFGKEVVLGQERRRAFFRQTDAEIVAQICREVKLPAEITDTTIRREQVVQIDQTDWSFIQRRAEVMGYLATARNGSLLFRPFAIEDTDFVVIVDGVKDQRSTVLSFEVAVHAFRQGEQVVATGYDKLQGRIVEVSSAPPTDPVTALSSSKTRRDAAAIGTIDGTRPTFYLGNPGHLANRDELRRIADAAEIASSFAVRAELCVDGETSIYPGSTIRVVDAARFSGVWYVAEVRHRLRASSGFETTFSLRRPFTAKFQRRNGVAAVGQNGAQVPLVASDWVTPTVEAVVRA